MEFLHPSNINRVKYNLRQMLPETYWEYIQSNTKSEMILWARTNRKTLEYSEYKEGLSGANENFIRAFLNRFTAKYNPYANVKRGENYINQYGAGGIAEFTGQQNEFNSDYEPLPTFASGFDRGGNSQRNLFTFDNPRGTYHTQNFGYDYIDNDSYPGRWHTGYHRDEDEMTLGKLYSNDSYVAGGEALQDPEILTHQTTEMQAPPRFIPNIDSYLGKGAIMTGQDAIMIGYNNDMTERNQRIVDDVKSHDNRLPCHMRKARVESQIRDLKFGEVPLVAELGRGDIEYIRDGLLRNVHRPARKKFTPHVEIIDRDPIDDELEITNTRKRYQYKQLYDCPINEIKPKYPRKNERGEYTGNMYIDRRYAQSCIPCQRRKYVVGNQY